MIIQGLDNGARQDISFVKFRESVAFIVVLCITVGQLIYVRTILTHIYKMYISNRTYRLAEMKHQHIPKCADLLANSFTKQNKVWSTINPTYQEVYQYMFDKATETLQWQNELRSDGTIAPDTFLNFIYLDRNDKIVAVLNLIELKQYLSKKSKVHLPHLQILQKVGEQCQRNIIPIDVEHGRSAYAMFSAVDEQVMGVGLAMLFWLDFGHYFHSQGFRVVYARMSNIKTFGWITRFGGLATKVQTMLNHKKMTFLFMRWHVDPIIYMEHVARIFKGRARL